MEIELKLGLTSVQARRLASQPLLEVVKPQTIRLFNTYYDTPDFALCQRGVALRLRRKGRSEWLMTVKGGNPSAGALAQRSEWEVPTQPGVFDFDCIDDVSLRDYLKSLQPDLRAVFSTDFTRTLWTLPWSEAVVEVALDRGKISRPAMPGEKEVASTPICELELELVSGDSPDALFEVAIDLAADIHLHPVVASKAERGYALARGSVGVPVKSAVLALRRGMSPGEAFREIALSCLLQLQRNEAGAVAGEDPEFVHLVRVAIRRLRSAFRLFSPVLAPAFIEVYAPRWKALSRQLADAREWDVFISDTVIPLAQDFPGDSDIAALQEWGTARRAQARAVAGKALKGRDYSRLVLAFAAALYRSAPPTIDSEALSHPIRLRRFAVRRLRRRFTAVQQIVREPGAMDDQRRHRLRIAIKKLRYALEFFAPLLPGKRVRASLARLALIQDMLGGLNDHASALRLLATSSTEARKLAEAWLAGRRRLLVEACDTELSSLASLRKPW